MKETSEKCPKRFYLTSKSFPFVKRKCSWVSYIVEENFVYESAKLRKQVLFSCKEQRNMKGYFSVKNFDKFCINFCESFLETLWEEKKVFSSKK